MAYDERLADGIRAAITALDGEVTERKMFGGLASMLEGHMFAGVVGQDLMLRLGEPTSPNVENVLPSWIAAAASNRALSRPRRVLARAPGAARRPRS